MKVFGSDGAPIVRRESVPADTALRYVLSHGFATAIIGIHTLEELEANLRAVRGFRPLSAAEMPSVESRVTGRTPRLFTLTA